MTTSFILILAFFVATQFFYTLSFIAILVAIILVLMYLLCVDEYYRVSVLKWTGIDLIVAGKLQSSKILQRSLMLLVLHHNRYSVFRLFCPLLLELTLSFSTQFNIYQFMNQENVSE